MPTFITLAKVIDQGIGNIREMPGRLAAFKSLASQLGVTVQSVYYTTGSHDMVLTLEGVVGQQLTHYPRGSRDGCHLAPREARLAGQRADRDVACTLGQRDEGDRHWTVLIRSREARCCTVGEA